MTRGALKKPGVYWINYDVNGNRKRARGGPDKRLRQRYSRNVRVRLWDHVNLKAGLTHRYPQDTRTEEGRSAP